MSNIKAITKPISIEEVIEIAEEKLINNPSDKELKTLIQKLKDMKIGENDSFIKKGECVYGNDDLS